MTTSEATRLAEELAAIGRVGALVAADAPLVAVFESVTAQVGQLVGADAAAMVRVETDSEVTCLGSWTKDGGYQAVGQRRRVASPSGVEGTVGDFLREQGWRASVGAPVVLEGRMWGILAVGSTAKDTLPEDTDTRLAKFSELVGTAVSNAKRGEDLALLDREQASLRRVVTLVAAESSPAEVFDAVTREAAQVLETEAIGMLRFEADAAPRSSHNLRRRGIRLRWGRASPSRSERDRRGASNGPDHPLRQLGRQHRERRRHGARLRHPLERRGADDRGGSAVGRGDPGHDRDRAPAVGYGDPNRAVHRAGRDRDRGRRGAQRAFKARGRTGCAETGGDAGGRGVTTRPAARQGGRGGGAPARTTGGLRDPPV